MAFKKIVLSIVFISFLFNCKNQTKPNQEIGLIPLPSSKIMKDGTFVLDSNTGIENSVNFKISVEFLKNYIESGSTITFNEDRSDKNIVFKLDENIKNYEGYSLEITPDKIIIKAKNDQGAFYAVQSLRQLLPPEFENGSFKDTEVSIPSLVIEDAPQYRYRGMHLDVGRHMYSVDFIKKYIDAIAMLKMNTFHWHLTEDQGWRIEIKKYPKLQEISAFRKETIVGHNNKSPREYDGEKYGGYYTQEEVKDIVKYAESRHVTIIPEIELPGHSQAALAAYPELGCTGEQFEVVTRWGVFKEIYCTKDSTFKFLEDVLDEVMTLFPSEYIHIGGDEAPKARWETCENCQNRIKTEGLKDEHELQSYFISRIEKYLNSKGRQIIGWDEILEGGLAPNATVMSWRGINGAIEAAKQNHDVIMTPTSHCYFDYYQSQNEDEPLAIGGFLPLEKVYGFNPIPEELTVEQSKHVLGVQGNIWTEYMPTEKQVEYMMFPRVLAMSELNWTQPKLKDYQNFSSRVENFHKRLDALDINYANHFYEIEGELIKNDSIMEYKLSVPTQNFDIRYTKDDSEPNSNSPVYSNPIQIKKSTTINAAVFNDKGEQLGASFTQYINYHKGLEATIKLNVEPNKRYSGSGANGLINGISGSDNRFKDNEWLGFSGEDIEITLEFEEAIDINIIKTRFFNTDAQWIHTPSKVEFVLDNDNWEFELPLTKDQIIPAKFNLNSSTKKIVLKIPNYGIIPEGKPGAGNKAWTFIDEIIIN